MLTWIENAPAYNVDCDENVIAYVDRHVSCSRQATPELQELVDLQTHKHSRTCRKKGQPLCKFRFPLPPMRSTVILTSFENAD